MINFSLLGMVGCFGIPGSRGMNELVEKKMLHGGTITARSENEVIEFEVTIVLS